MTDATPAIPPRPEPDAGINKLPDPDNQTIAPGNPPGNMKPAGTMASALPIVNTPVADIVPKDPDLVAAETAGIPPAPEISLLPEAAPEPQFRMEAHTYIDQSGRQVTEMVCVKGIAPRDVVRFMIRGEVKIQSKQPGPNGSPGKPAVQSIPVQLAVQATDLDNAFEIYDATLRDYGEKYVAAMKEQHVRGQLLAAGQGGLIKPG